jgi:hypothetical protein
MGRINQQKVPSVKTPSETLTSLLYKKANIWLTTLAVLVIVVGLLMMQVTSLIAEDYSLASTSYASTTKARSKLRGLLSFVLPPRTSSESGNANQGSQNNTAATANLSGASVPTGDCSHLSQNIVRSFFDGNNSGFDSAAIEARDAAWRASNPNFPGPNVGPGAPTVAATGSLPNVSNLFTVAGKKSPFQFAAAKGKDAFTVINAQGGITEKYAQIDMVINWGDGKTTSTYVGDKNYDHVYAAPGTYNIKAKAWYFCYALGGFDVHGRPSRTAIDPTKPLHVSPGSPEATFKVTVVSAAEADSILAGPDLLMQNGPSLLSGADSTIKQGKNKIFKPSGAGGPDQFAVANVVIKNIGSASARVTKVAFSDASVFARQSVKRVAVKQGSKEIGVLSWPILNTNPTDATQYGIVRSGIISLTSPIVIAAGQSETISLDAIIAPAVFTGKSIVSNVTHQFCITALETPDQLIPPDGVYSAGGTSTASTDDGVTRTFTNPAGCGESFEVKNGDGTAK